ncbi:50S ribosomal protein L9 [Candidatus Peregrinibacteria bacterium]|nr:50S ribosomal protein L9 [Candidatus Peregrinibacteria bacterium]
MKVIFTDNVSGVALRGDVKNVKPGFFRNYLLPYKKAVPATDVLLRQWEECRKKMLIETENLKAKLEEMKRRFAETKLFIEKKVTKKGTLYGGVKASDITSAIKQQLNIDIPLAAVIMEKAIKNVGVHDVKLRLGEGIEMNIPVEILEKK